MAKRPQKTIQARTSIATPRDSIVIRGARVNNLKNIDLDIPRNKLIVFTGVSGSGKSSLAFDTIYAEGQRRYVESLSSYARQFLVRMDKPDVDLIQGISPAMAIEQKSNTRNPRSTVATSTEVYDYLRLLFARVGKSYCKKCGREVKRDSIKTVMDVLTNECEQKGVGSLKLYIAFHLPVHPKETLATSFANLQKEGFFRIVRGDDIIDLTKDPAPNKGKADDFLVLVDRIVFKRETDNPQFVDSIETAFVSGSGRATIMNVESKKRIQFDQNFSCTHCNITYDEPEPRLFSFNNPFGACPECQGFGRAIGIDMDLVVPDRAKSLKEGAIVPWTTPKFQENHKRLLAISQKTGLRIDIPFSDLTAGEIEIVMNGFGEYDGVKGFFKKLEKKTYKIYYRVLLSRYRGYTTCLSCNGDRLRPEALSVRLNEKNIGDVVRMTISNARQFCNDLELTPYEQDIAKRIVAELQKRLQYLDEVGLGYLSLDRLSSTLSGGESQRINLATSLGSTLVGAVYVLDEPSIGLHPRDNYRLLSILKALRDVGNTVIVVEHDAEMMRASDVVVDIGPQAGEHGGEIVYNGRLSGLVEHPSSLTGAYLAGRKFIPVPPRRTLNGTFLEVFQAEEHNLKKIDVRIPLHALVCITGVSGSGKSTFVHDILFAGLSRMKGEFSGKVGTFKSINGAEQIEALQLVDQSPIGKTPRSNPVTYVQVFDLIRNLFASTQASKIHGFTPGHFSFNVPGGRCDACEGDGMIKVEMQFLADIFLECDSCKGKRYKKEVLEIRYRNKSVDDVLSMTVKEAIMFFQEEPSGRKVAKKLKVLDDVGLGYLRLGQSSASLSGGEAQRIKLAAHLSAPERSGHTLFIFDEPTTGLHFDDIAKLLTCFNALIESGNSVVIVEHNLDVIKCADHIIDLGPDAGENGGRVVATGTPEEVVTNERSFTAKYLKPLLWR